MGVATVQGMNSMASSMDITVEQLAQRLETHIRSLGDRVLVAYSGGVDSTVVLKAATRALGKNATGILADTESNTEEDIALARRIAEEHGLQFEVINYSELAIENYAENPVNRCFFCKSALYTHLTNLANDRTFDVICDGTNTDDVGDYRPGLKAVSQQGIRSPLRETNLSKTDVRALAKYYGLPNHERPSSPCLSSRIPYGTTITREKLDQVAQAERYLASLGIREFRCRHHEKVARLEVPLEQFGIILAHRDEIVAELRRIGFLWVALDLAGFQSGSLNRVINSSNAEDRT